MKNYREFKLYNELGQMLDLTDPNSIYLEDPDGLGFSKKITYYMDNENVEVTSEEWEPKTLGGTIIFNNGGYERFALFNLFLSNAETLYLEYALPIMIPDTSRQLKGKARCRFKVLEKGELDENEVLRSRVSILVEEPFTSEVVQTTFINSQTTGKQYDYHYDEETGYRYGSGAKKETLIPNFSNIKMPILLTLRGPITSPTIRVISQKSGQTAVLWKYKPDLLGDETLLHDSRGKIKDQKITVNGVNRYQEVERKPGYSSRILIPPGKHLLQIETESTEFGDCYVKYQFRWWVM